MKRGTTVFLKIAVFLIGITVLALCIFWLPWLANDTAEMFPEFAFLQYPVLIGLYVTVIPFFLALYQALKLLNYIENNNAFSELSVKVLKYIKYCAIIGLTIIFTSVVIAVFTAVLQKLLKNVLDIKSENDFTV